MSDCIDCMYGYLSWKIKHIKYTKSVADLHTKVSGAHPPNRTKFFNFYICFHQKAPVSEVGTPSNEGWHPPQWEILDPPLQMVL